MVWKFIMLPVLFFICSWLLCVPGQAVHAACLDYSNLIKNGGYGIADSSGNVTDGCNLDTAYIPASVVKILTALSAFRILGPAYRFTTEFYLDDNQVLYIKGYGDPLLLSEDVRRIASRLKTQQLKHIRGLFIDNSEYALDDVPPGSSNSSNAYDAPVAATSVNFNSLPVRVDTRGRVFSSEPQTPWLPLMQEIGHGRKPGTHRVNICVGGCRPKTTAARYTSELFIGVFKDIGITVSGESGARTVPAIAKRIFVYRNPRTLEEVVKNMLYYSSNFIANQLFLACGAKRFGYPATWEKSATAIQDVLQEALGGDMSDAAEVVDGAGLSRQNKMSVRSMLKILEVFVPYKLLLRKYRGVLAKTGTLQGVYNYAGYFPDGNPYVIFLNQSGNNRATLLDRLKIGHLEDNLFSQGQWINKTNYN